MSTNNIDNSRPILGVPFAAPLSGKDTVGQGLVKTRPGIAIIHMSTLLEVVIQHNESYRALRERGGLLPPEEAVKAFRRGFTQVVNPGGKPADSMPHIFANGACREETETKANLMMVQRMKPGTFQAVGLRFLLDKEHIQERAQARVNEAIAQGKKPRSEDLGRVPFDRYKIFHQNLSPVLMIFEKRGGVIIDINANETPEKVLSQVTGIYDQVTLPTLA